MSQIFPKLIHIDLNFLKDFFRILPDSKLKGKIFQNCTLFTNLFFKVFYTIYQILRYSLITNCFVRFCKEAVMYRNFRSSKLQNLMAGYYLEIYFLQKILYEKMVYLQYRRSQIFSKKFKIL